LLADFLFEEDDALHLVTLLFRQHLPHALWTVRL
jgi:hypothetical protein